MRGVKGSKIVKERTRLWTGDVYKAMVLGTIPKITGIEFMTISQNFICISYVNNPFVEFTYPINGDHSQIRNTVKTINERLKTI